MCRRYASQADKMAGQERLSSPTPAFESTLLRPPAVVLGLGIESRSTLPSTSDKVDVGKKNVVRIHRNEEAHAEAVRKETGK